MKKTLLNNCGKWAGLVLGLASASLSPARAAAGNPEIGYGHKPYYVLPYAKATNLGKSPDPGELTVNLTIGGQAFPKVTLDTGSRALYLASFQVTGNLGPAMTPGYVILSSSARVFNGTWYQAEVGFPEAVAKNGATGVATATMLVLVVDSVTAFPPLGSANIIAATFDVNQVSGNATLSDGTLLPYTNSTLSLLPGQAANFTANPGLFKSMMNFGVGFNRLGVAPDNDEYNQQFDAFLNLTQMQSGEMVAGYVVTPTGVYLGLSEVTKGFAYTNLVPTGFAQVPGSPPDWQAPMGTVTYGNRTYRPGQILVDSGIPRGILTLPGGPLNANVTNLPLTVNLLNSRGGVSYEINNTPNNWLIPTDGNTSALAFTWSGTLPRPGILSEDLPPYLYQFINLGRNVLNGFDFLYDATNGYVGMKLRPNAANITAANVQFTAGFFPNPVAPVAPFLYLQPRTQHFPLGKRGVFSASARGNPAPKYQWQMFIDGRWKNVQKGFVFQGVATATLQFLPNYSMNNYKFRVVATSSAGRVVSRAVQLKITLPTP